MVIRIVGNVQDRLRAVDDLAKSYYRTIRWLIERPVICHEYVRPTGLWLSNCRKERIDIRADSLTDSNGGSILYFPCRNGK